MLCLSDRFASGYSRVFDLYGTAKKWPDYSNGPARDLEALKGDWIKVGKTIKKETESFHTAGGHG